MFLFQKLPRVMGGVFLIGWANGSIPWQFAIPAGLGGIWAGFAAWQAVRAIKRGDPNAEQLIWRANIVGLVDFVIAVFTGLITSVGTFFTAQMLSIDALRRARHAAALPA